MSDLTSKEKADRLRQLADLVDDMPHAVAWEVQRALREHADLVERPSEARGPLTTLQKERNYKTHKTRMSDASSFDEICTECGATDFPGSDLLDLPCPKAAPPHEPGEIHRIALDGLNGNDVYAYAALTKIAMATDPSLSAPHEPQERRCWWPDCKETAGQALCDATRRALTKGETP